MPVDRRRSTLHAQALPRKPSSEKQKIKKSRNCQDGRGKMLAARHIYKP